MDGGLHIVSQLLSDPQQVLTSLEVVTNNNPQRIGTLSISLRKLPGTRIAAISEIGPGAPEQRTVHSCEESREITEEGYSYMSRE